MLGAVFYGEGDLRVEELPMPEVGIQDVCIRVMACGICGTDLHIFHGDQGAAATPPGTVLGHEFSGIVDAVGCEVTNFKVGDRVSVDPNQTCGLCDFCRNGDVNFCENVRGIGTTEHGGFAEYCSVNQSQAYKLPESISFEEGAMNEPLACCLHGIDLCEIEAGQTVLVLGGGMIGLLMLQLARIRGAKQVVLSEPIAQKRLLAESLGADLCIDPTAENIESTLKQHGIHQIDLVIECVGKSATISQAISLTGKKGIAMLFGLTSPEDTVAINPFELFTKEITIKTSFINPFTQKRALDLIGSRKVDVSSMLLETRSLLDLPEILADPKQYTAGKIVIDPWKSTQNT